jgi:4-hydroxy-tetrahydrodipicolinate synthase
MMEQFTARRATMRRQQQQQQQQQQLTTIGAGSAAAAASSASAPAHAQRTRRRRPSTAVAVLAPAASPKAKAAGVQQLKSTALITAVKTPYLPNGKFDLVAYDALLEQQIAHGVGGVIVGGTTGEGQLMSWDEHIMLIAHTVVCFGDKLQVIGNTGSNSTGEALHATEQGFAVGMHAALQINPYYGKTSEQGLKAHFDAVLAEGPGIVYNVPGRTGQDIPDRVIMGLAERHPSNFLGVKECTGNARIEGYASRGVACWSGNDDEAHDARHHHSGSGVISVTSNLVPGLFSRMMHGDKPEPELAASLEPLMAWLFCEPNPIALNTALAMCGLAQPVFRLPYVPLSRAQREEGAKLLRAVQEHIPGCKEVRVMEDDEFKLIGRY